MRSPMRSLAVWPSTERTSGFWIILVFVSVRTAFAVRLGLVDVLNDLLCEQQLVRCVADDDGILRVQLLNALQVQQLAQPGHNFSNVLRLEGVRKIDRFDSLLFV